MTPSDRLRELDEGVERERVENSIVQGSVWLDAAVVVMNALPAIREQQEAVDRILAIASDARFSNEYLGIVVRANVEALAALDAELSKQGKDLGAE